MYLIAALKTTNIAPRENPMEYNQTALGLFRFSAVHLVKLWTVTTESLPSRFALRDSSLMNSLISSLEYVITFYIPKCKKELSYAKLTPLQFVKINLP